MPICYVYVANKITMMHKNVFKLSIWVFPYKSLTKFSARDIVPPRGLPPIDFHYHQGCYAPFSQ